MSVFATSTQQNLDAIIDAVACGRLTPCDVAGITDAELEVLFALGQNRLETGQLEHANYFFTALVTMMPYRARYWRALGISAHHLGAFLEARRAYEAALYLDPEHKLSACWAAQVCVLLGEDAQAKHWLKQAKKSSETQVQKLVLLLEQPSYGQQLRHLVNDFQLQIEQTATQSSSDGFMFTTSSGKTLPLENSPWKADKTADIVQPKDMDAFLSAAGHLTAQMPADPRIETITNTFVPQTAVTTEFHPSQKTGTTKASSAKTVRSAKTHSQVPAEATAARRLGVSFLQEMTKTKT